MSLTRRDIERWREEVDDDPGFNHDVFIRRDKLEVFLDRLDALERVREALELICYSNATIGTRTYEQFPTWFKARLQDGNEALSSCPALEDGEETK